MRSEGIQFNDDEQKFENALQAYVASLSDYALFLHNLARTAEEAEEPDPALAFERYRRAYLVSGEARDIDGIERVHKRIRGLSSKVQISDVMNSNRRSLSDEITSFLRLAGR